MRVIFTFRAAPKRYAVEEDIYDNGTYAGIPSQSRTLIGALWTAWRWRRFTGKAARVVRWGVSE